MKFTHEHLKKKLNNFGRIFFGWMKQELNFEYNPARHVWWRVEMNVPIKKINIHHLNCKRRGLRGLSQLCVCVGGVTSHDDRNYDWSKYIRVFSKLICSLCCNSWS